MTFVQHRLLLALRALLIRDEKVYHRNKSNPRKPQLSKTQTSRKKHAKNNLKAARNFLTRATIILLCYCGISHRNPNVSFWLQPNIFHFM